MKITAWKPRFSFKIRLVKPAWVLRSFHQRADALGAQNLPDFVTTFDNTDGLQVGPERPLGGFLGPRAVATEGRFLTTMCTLSHFTNSFQTNECWSSLFFQELRSEVLVYRLPVSANEQTGFIRRQIPPSLFAARL
jgi:hypothetical protein